MKAALLRAIEKLLGEKILTVQAIQGGDINQAFKIDVKSKSFFIKTNDIPGFSSNFTCEVEGLTLLKNASNFHCPQVISSGEYDGSAFLILSFIQSGLQTKDFWEIFGRRLAELHMVKQKHYGHGISNYIGSLHQSNKICSDWPSFFRSQRLMPQVKLAQEQNIFTMSDLKMFDKLYERLDSLLPMESASLIHGDLWSGNFICSVNHEPYLIDPSVTYAHREMDLAMSRLFGGFDPLFYDAYYSRFPLSPGFEKRLALLQLYYILVHVNLFGGHYIDKTRQILRKYI